MRHAQVAKKRAHRWGKAQYAAPNTSTRESIYMKLMHKPIFAVLTAAVVVGLGGTTYAAIGGIDSITALFGGAKQLPSSRIVKVDLQNCHDVNAFNVVTGTGKGNAPRYYEVQANAHVSDQQMVSMARSICRASYNPQMQQSALASIQNMPQNRDKLVGNAEGTIVALTGHSMDIRVSGNVTSDRQPFVEHFTSLDPELAVFDASGMQQKLPTLQVGDVVYSEYRASGDALVSSETMPLNRIDWSKQTLVVVFKQSPDAAVYDQYQKLVSNHSVQQVVPCHATASGYCTFEQLQQAKH